MAHVAPQNLLRTMTHRVKTYRGLGRYAIVAQGPDRPSEDPEQRAWKLELASVIKKMVLGTKALREATYEHVLCFLVEGVWNVPHRCTRVLGPHQSRFLTQSLVRGRLVSALALIGTVVAQTPSVAQEEENGVVRYAPGATGRITSDLVEMMRRAKSDSDALKERLTIQGPMSRPEIDLDAVRDQALSDPRVRKLLGADGEPPDPDLEKWQHAQAFLFASFSMSPALLREMMEGAAQHNIPVVFRGFHKNSVHGTQDALLEVFGSLEEVQGFSIDPTLFTHFDVQAVPTLVLLKDPYEMCATQACGEDVAPAHDRIKGGIKVDAALDIVSRGAGEASEVAKRLIEEAS